MGILYEHWLKFLEEVLMLSTDARSIYLGVICYFFSVFVLRREPLSWRAQRLGLIAAFAIFFFDMGRLQVQKIKLPPELLMRQVWAYVWSCAHGILIPLAFKFFGKWLLQNKANTDEG